MFGGTIKVGTCGLVRDYKLTHKNKELKFSAQHGNMNMGQHNSH